MNREHPPPEETTPPGEGALDSDRADEEEAAAIAAERIRSGAAEKKEDGAAALEGLGISVSTEDTLDEDSGPRAATKEEWESFLQEHGPNMLPPDGEG